MKISKLQKFAGLFIALALGTMTISAQGYGRGNRAFAQNNRNVTCVNYLSGLSDKQAEKITALETKHQEEMSVLRQKRRSTANWDEKNQVRDEMLENVASHREGVRNLLNKDQQKEYDQLLSQGKKYRNQPNCCAGAQSRGNKAGKNYSRGRNGRGNNQRCQRFN